MSKKGSEKTTTTVNYDTEAWGAMKDLAETQTGIMKEQYDHYKKYFQEYEISAIQADKELLPYASEAARLTLEEQSRDITANRELKDALRTDQLAEIQQSRPVAEKYYKDALEGVNETDYMNRAQADVEHGFKGSAESLVRQAGLYGITTGDQGFKKSLSDLALDKALGIAGARTAARKTAQDTSFARLSDAMAKRSGGTLHGVTSTTGANQTTLSSSDPLASTLSAGSTASSSLSQLLQQLGTTSKTTQKAGWGDTLMDLGGLALAGYGLSKWKGF